MDPFKEFRAELSDLIAGGFTWGEVLEAFTQEMLESEEKRGDMDRG